MLNSRIKSKPRNVSLHIGHLLLNSWVCEDPYRKKKFQRSVNSISTSQDAQLVTKIINQAADQCWEEFQEIYDDTENMSSDEFQNKVDSLKKIYSN